MSIACVLESLDRRQLFCEMHAALALAEPELLAVSQTIRINFQPATAPVPPGHLVDAGNAFGGRGNGQSYGWNVDNASGARDRNAAASPSQAHDTLNHMQLGGQRDWRISLAAGR
jgi:hypothetical protein